MPQPTLTPSLKLLDDFAAAFDRHDLDALMAMMTEDCVFETAAGPDGKRIAVKDSFRKDRPPLGA